MVDGTTPSSHLQRPAGVGSRRLRICFQWREADHDQFVVREAEQGVHQDRRVAERRELRGEGIPVAGNDRQVRRRHRLDARVAALHLKRAVRGRAAEHGGDAAGLAHMRQHGRDLHARDEQVDRATVRRHLAAGGAADAGHQVRPARAERERGPVLLHEGGKFGIK
jgi:hypothetical protein